MRAKYGEDYYKALANRTAEKNARPAIERFWKYVRIEDKGYSTPCWSWTGAKRNLGYGQFVEAGKHYQSHRWAYQYFVGPIPEGYELDHLCRNPNCVNPTHLEPVTHAENMRRGMSPGAISARTNRCKRGHELTSENTRIVKRNGKPNRTCLICYNAAVQAFYRRHPDYEKQKRARMKERRRLANKAGGSSK